MSAFEPAEMLRRMADRLEKIDRAEFSGVLIVLPPADQDGSFKSIELLVIDPARDAANFWFMTKTKVDAAVAQFDEAARLRERRQGGMR